MACRLAESDKPSRVTVENDDGTLSEERAFGIDQGQSVAGGGISCGATCSAEIDSGSRVTLAAAAAEGSTFAGWGGVVPELAWEKLRALGEGAARATEKLF